MNRFAHAWFLIGMLMSFGLAIGLLLIAAAVGGMNTPGKIIALVAADLIVTAMASKKISRWCRVRRRMHERISRELRCKVSFVGH